jgi:hypothetical protein
MQSPLLHFTMRQGPRILVQSIEVASRFCYGNYDNDNNSNIIICQKPG